MYLLGVLTGLVVAIILVLGSLISHRKGVNLNDKLEKVADVLVPPQRGSVFKPDKCENCKKAPPDDLANISQEYKRDLLDWEWLCRKCHMIGDGRIFNLKQYANN